MSVETYWISKTFVVEWKLTDLAGVPANATVAGTVSRPDGTPASMSVANPAVGTYRITYDPAAAGYYGWRATATGTLDDAEEGEFYVKASRVGGDPATLDPTSDIGMVRLLISDTDEDNLIFRDTEISALLILEGGAVRLAAAQALDTVASNELMVSKVIRTQDLQTDGAKLSAELRARAASLREQHENAGDDYTGFEVVDFEPYAARAAELAEWPV